MERTPTLNKMLQIDTGKQKNELQENETAGLQE
jgi:hypothetical protein